LNFASQRRAQANSIPKIASPSGMMRIEGPGNTIITIPINNTVSPISRMKSCRMVRNVAASAATVAEQLPFPFGGTLGSGTVEGAAGISLNFSQLAGNESNFMGHKNFASRGMNGLAAGANFSRFTSSEPRPAPLDLRRDLLNSAKPECRRILRPQVWSRAGCPRCSDAPGTH
jgi:hypothetical protein